MYGAWPYLLHQGCSCKSIKYTQLNYTVTCLGLATLKSLSKWCTRPTCPASDRTTSLHACMCVCTYILLFVVAAFLQRPDQLQELLLMTGALWDLFDGMQLGSIVYQIKMRLVLPTKKCTKISSETNKTLINNPYDCYLARYTNFGMAFVKS